MGLTQEQIELITDIFLPYIDEWLEELENKRDQRMSYRTLITFRFKLDKK